MAPCSPASTWTTRSGISITRESDALPNVKLLRLILKDAGYRVLEAGSGPEALDILRWNPNRRPP